MSSIGIVKVHFDTTSTNYKIFEIGDLVLKWEKSHEEKGNDSKFQRLWLGQFQIIVKIG